MISVIIRTYNEEKYLQALLQSLKKQQIKYNIEIIIVDSGSTDQTQFFIKQIPDIHLVTIRKEQFTYGYALNQGLLHACGDIAVSISAHCLPVSENWLELLIAPLENDNVAIAYGRQFGDVTSRCSERREFDKLFPSQEQILLWPAFSHNANCAFKMAIWRKCPFNETLTGLEDLDFALRIHQCGYQSFYVPEASVFHYHQENNKMVFRRYYREAFALRQIQPSINMSLYSILQYGIKEWLADCSWTLKRRIFWRKFRCILGYRLAQCAALIKAYVLDRQALGC